MKILFFSTIVPLAVFLLASCQKDSNVFVPNEGQQLDSAWTTNITANSQVLILSKQLQGGFDVQEMSNLLLDTSVITNTGIHFSFPLNGLLLNGTTTLTSGLKIEYAFLQKKGDYIRYGVQTSANQYPLESGGALHIKLSSNGQPVTLAGNKKLSIRFRDSDPRPNMNVFYGNTNVVTNPLSFNWVLSTDNSLVKLWDSTNINPLAKGYIIETYKSGWVNAGRPLETVEPRVEIKAVLPDLFSNANSAVYMVFKNSRTVLQLSANSSTRNFSFPNIPANQDVRFISISKVGGSYYIGVKDEKTTNNMVVFIKPELTTFSSILNYINSL